MRSKTLRCVPRRLVLALIAALVPAGSSPAQTLPAGVINAPPTVIGDSESIGSNTTLNVSDGGVVGSHFDAGDPNGTSTQVEVNILGGRVGPRFVSHAESVVNVYGGVVDTDFTILAGGAASIDGGSFGERFSSVSGGDLTIRGGSFGTRFQAAGADLVGGEYYLNGVEFTESEISLSSGDVFSGTLASGNTFVFSRDAFDQLFGVSLTTAPLPTIDTSLQVVDGTTNESPLGLRTGQSLSLRDGGSIGDHFAVVGGASLAIDGGVLGDGAEVAGSSVQVSGGTIGHGFRAYAGSSVQISGGTVGNEFHAYAGSTVDISGGVFDRKLVAQSGSAVRISGGSFGNIFRADLGTLELLGGEFELNGEQLTVPERQILQGDVLTGTFADGSPFIISAVADGVYSFKATAASLPAIKTTPILVSAGSVASSGLRRGESLTMLDGGTIRDNFQVVGGTALIEGGAMGDGVEVAGGEVTIRGGSVGAGFEAYAGSIVTIDGGAVAGSFDAWEGSTVVINGGSVGQSMRAFGSRIEITGGEVGGFFDVYEDSELTISGGTFGRRLRVSDSSVELIGGEYRVNGVEYTGSEYTLVSGDVFSGTLADGSTFVFSRDVDDRLGTVALTSVPLPVLETSPIMLDGTNPEEAPQGLRSGQSLTLLDGAALGDNFAAVNSTLVVDGGVVGIDAELDRGVIDLRSGAIDDGLRVYDGGALNASGGTWGERLHLESGSQLNLVGSQFSIDGVVIDGLTPETPFVVEDRNVELSGLLADGTEFSVDLYWIAFLTRDYVSNGSLLTLTLVPDPGDYNGDGLVDATDYDAWQSSYGETVVPYSGADGNGDGAIDAADYAVWRDHLSAGSQTVPEPSALIVALTVVLATRLRRQP